MKAVVWHGVGDIRVDDVADPTIQEPTDTVIEITTSALCGTDLHFVRGTMAGMVEGTILGHEAVGVVREVGPQVRNLTIGDRVVIPSTIGCGACFQCRAGRFAQCDDANPNGSAAGTCFFGGSGTTGPVDGLQAEFARIPFAHVGPVPLPDSVSDDQAIMLSDVYPTAWFGCRLADVSHGDTVLVLGAGAVGQFAITSAFQQGAGRVLCVDGIASRLDQARRRGAEVIDLNAENPVASRTCRRRRTRTPPSTSATRPGPRSPCCPEHRPRHVVRRRVVRRSAAPMSPVGSRPGTAVRAHRERYTSRR